jgi:D-alanyl-D-alanine carboxypeptidase
MTSRFRTLIVALLGGAAVLPGIAAVALAGPGAIRARDTAGAATAPAVPSPAGAPATDEARGLRASLRAALEAYLERRRTPEHISAVSLRVAFPGRRHLDVAVGSTRFDGGRAISTKSLWQIGSNAKAFTSVVLLQLAAEGILSIDDTLARWLPQYPDWGHITIRQLLNMTSGIPDYLAVPAFLQAYAAAPDTVFPAPELVSYAAGLPLLPGWNYSNTSYILAQMIIERATGDTLAGQLRRRIIGPLGLRNTFYCPDGCRRAVIKRLPSSYLFFSSTFPELASLYGKDQRRRNLSYAQGAGGIISSLSDLTTWLRALYEGRLLPPEQQRQLESLVAKDSGQPILGPSAEHPLGFGLGVSQVLTGLGTLWVYEGETLGARVVHLFAPVSGIVVTIGANSATDGDDDRLAGLLFTVYEMLHAGGHPRCRQGC